MSTMTPTQPMPTDPTSGVPAAAVGRAPYRISVEQYEDMVRKGVFTKRDRVELIEGQLVAKMTKNPPHSVTGGLCLDVLGAALPAGWHIRGEQPVRIPSRSSEPEPDLSVVRGQRMDWLDNHPGPDAIGLIVEAADSSVEEDRKMAPIYLGGRIPAYWIVNIRDRQLEVYTGEGCVILRESDTVDLILDGQVVARIAVVDLLPKRA